VTRPLVGCVAPFTAPASNGEPLRRETLLMGAKTPDSLLVARWDGRKLGDYPRNSVVRLLYCMISMRLIQPARLLTATSLLATLERATLSLATGRRL
jgi:hypothetical protein